MLTAPDGTQTTLEYAADPRLGLSAPIVSKEVMTTPGGRTSTRTFTRAATLSNPTDPFSFTTLTDTENLDGHISTRIYTKASKTFVDTSAVGRRVTTVLDAKDRVSSLTEGLGRTPSTFTYDPQGRLTDDVRGPLHQTYGYDSRDRLTTSEDAAGRGESYTYDGADRPQTLTDGVGGVASFSYDGEGGLTGVQEPSGKTHAQSLDGYSLLQGYTPPGGAPQQTLSRDNDGLVSAWNQSAGHTGTVSRDSGGRPTALSATGDTTNFTYSDNTDRPATASTDRAGSAQDQALALEWDSQLLTKLTYSGPATVASGTITLDHDGRDNLTQSRLQSGSTDVTTTYGYDNDDLRTSEDPTSGAAFTFTRGGALGELTRVDDTTGRTDYTYDGLGRQATTTGNVPTTTTRFSQTHTYDAGDLLATRDEDLGTGSTHLDYEYDGAGRLTKVKRGGSDSETYAYDADGNRTTRATPATGGTESATYDAQGRLATRGGISYSFDSAGFLAQRGSDTFNYGPQGRLLSANVGGDAITYAYDGIGRRTARTTGAGTETYLYGDPDDPWQLSASRDPSGQLTQYFYDPYGRLVSFERGGTRFYVFTDPNGSPRLITDSAGTAQKRINYDAYGDILSDSNPSFALRVGYAGGLKDPTSGLVMFGLRDYEPASGRWTSRDPILFDGGQTNLYAYVGNDPVNSVDPDGTGPSSGLVKMLLDCGQPPPESFEDAWRRMKREIGRKPNYVPPQPPLKDLPTPPSLIMPTWPPTLNPSKCCFNKNK